MELDGFTLVRRRRHRKSSKCKALPSSLKSLSLSTTSSSCLLQNIKTWLLNHAFKPDMIILYGLGPLNRIGNLQLKFILDLNHILNPKAQIHSYDPIHDMVDASILKSHGLIFHNVNP